MDIAQFDSHDSAEVDAWIALSTEIRRADGSWRPSPTPRATAAEFEFGWDGEPVTPYLGRVDGVVVAAGSIGTSDYDNLHVGWIEIEVHPAHRRRGHGSTMLQHLADVARSRGRRLLELGGEESAAVVGFAHKHGCRGPQYVEEIRRLDVATFDWAHADELYDAALPHAADYRFEKAPFPSRVEDLDELAAVTGVINDAPTDDLDVEDEVYSAQRVQGYESAQSAHGYRMYRVIVRHLPTEAIAGHTVVAVYGESPEGGEQQDTAVVPTHRGHRLGLLLKIEMMRWLRESEPQLRRLDTGNAGSNGPMIGVNEQLGYRLVSRMPYYEYDLAQG